MIPLAKWLRDDDVPSSIGVMASLSEIEATSNQDQSALQQAAIQEAYERGRAEAAGEADAAHAQAMANFAAQAAAREADIAAEWSAKFSEQLADGIQSSFRQMRSSLETALETVLANLLGTEVRLRIATSLMQVIDDEISAAKRLPVEIGAPEYLHDQIRGQCETRGFAVSITDSPQIKVTFQDGLLRYEDMSKQWDDMVRGITS